MKIPSKKEIDENRGKDFPLIPHEEYKLVITEAKETQQPKYDNQEMLEDVVNITFTVEGYKTGTDAPVDADGEVLVNRKVWFNARPNSMGFQQDGTPAKTRCLVYYALGQTDLLEELEFEDWQDLVGKTVYAEISQKANQKGKQVNFISRFVLPPRK